MRLIKSSETTAARRRLYFHLVDATDGLTAETAEAAGQPQISTNGAGWTATGIGVLVAIGNGRYYAELTEAVVATAGDIIESRYKSAATAECPGDSAQVVAFDPADAADLGLSNLDAAVSSRSSHSAADVWTSTTRTLSAFSTALALSVWDALQAAAVVSASMGALVKSKLGMITSGTSLTIVSPVTATGLMTIVQGDDYSAAQSRQIEWTRTTWPNLTGATVTFKSRAPDGETFSKAMTASVVGSGSQTVYLELGTTDTASFEPSDAYTYDIQAVLSDGDIATLVRGGMRVREDV